MYYYLYINNYANINIFSHKIQGSIVQTIDCIEHSIVLLSFKNLRINKSSLREVHKPHFTYTKITKILMTSANKCNKQCVIYNFASHLYDITYYKIPGKMIMCLPI